MRLISCFELKQKLLEERKKIYRMGGETTFGQATIHGIRIALRLMDQCLPQGEVVPVAVPVVHGRWITNWCDNNMIGHEYEECSECGAAMLDTNQFWDCNYCPNCGAKMDGGNNG